MKLFGLIGKRLDYSFSSAYFNRKFKELGLRDHAYLNIELSDISEFPTALKQLDLRGINVTIPYKESIIPFLSELSPEAESIGAVNTITRSGNALVGHNTDWIGFKESLAKQFSNALILGTGGASKAIQYALEQMDIAFSIVSRSGDLNYEHLNGTLHAYDLIINCTPLGTYPNVEEFPPISLDELSSQHHVYDLVYNPQQTRLMREAQERGATVQNGYDMLVKQAEAAWGKWLEVGSRRSEVGGPPPF